MLNLQLIKERWENFLNQNWQVVYDEPVEEFVVLTKTEEDSEDESLIAYTNKEVIANTIASAPQDIATLVVEIERLRKELDKVREAAEFWYEKLKRLDKDA